MSNKYWRVFLGIGLLLFGAVALLQATNVIDVQGKMWGFFFAGLFLLGGVIFLSVLASDRKQWWTAIPGFTLLGLGVLVGSSMVSENLAPFGATFFFLGISLAFWVIYFLQRERWWALIPAGVLLSLAAVTGYSQVEESMAIGKFVNGGGVFLLGLGLTFALVAILHGRKNGTTWAWIPGGILIVLGFIAGLEETELGKFVLPAGLVIAGIFLIGRAFAKKGTADE